MDEVEIWQSTTESTCWVLVKDKRTNNGWKHRRIAGKNSPGHKIQITREEREFNSEQIPEENDHLDPFRNGALVCTSGRPAEERTRYELTDEDLIGILDIEDDVLFDEAISDIGIELPLRRLQSLAETHSTMTRYIKIRDLIDARYRVGGTQRSVQEMIDAGEKLTGTSVY